MDSTSCVVLLLLLAWATADPDRQSGVERYLSKRATSGRRKEALAASAPVLQKRSAANLGGDDDPLPLASSGSLQQPAVRSLSLLHSGGQLGVNAEDGGLGAEADFGIDVGNPSANGRRGRSLSPKKPLSLMDPEDPIEEGYGSGVRQGSAIRRVRSLMPKKPDGQRYKKVRSLYLMMNPEDPIEEGYGSGVRQGSAIPRVRSFIVDGLQESGYGSGVRQESAIRRIRSLSAMKPDDQQESWMGVRQESANGKVRSLSLSRSGRQISAEYEPEEHDQGSPPNWEADSQSHENQTVEEPLQQPGEVGHSDTREVEGSRPGRYPVGRFPPEAEDPQSVGREEQEEVREPGGVRFPQSVGLPSEAEDLQTVAGGQAPEQGGVQRRPESHVPEPFRHVEFLHSGMHGVRG